MNTIWFLAIPLFAVADRMIGKGGNGARSSTFLVIIVASISAAILTHMYGPAALMAFWLAYRTPPWSYWGTTTPRTLEQYLGSMLRHCLPAVASTVLWQMGYVNEIAVLSLLIYGILATGMSAVYAEEVDKIAEDVDVPLEVRNATQAKLNGKFEILRGGMYGLALFISQAVL